MQFSGFCSAKGTLLRLRRGFLVLKNLKILGSLYLMLGGFEPKIREIQNL
jgi:hypothetical protein